MASCSELVSTAQGRPATATLPRAFRSPVLALPMMALTAGAVMSLLYLVDPRVAGNYPPCPFLFLTGCYCPGCGALRALHRLLHGDLAGALGYNAMAVMMLPALGLVGFSRAVGRPLLTGFEFPHRLAWALLAAIVLFFVLRNVPVYPLTVLAP